MISPVFLSPPESRASDSPRRRAPLFGRDRAEKVGSAIDNLVTAFDNFVKAHNADRGLMV